jgi:hypothetical protein
MLQILNPNIEIRNKFEYLNFNAQKLFVIPDLIRNLFWSFVIRYCFVLRASNFGFTIERSTYVSTRSKTPS